MTALQSMHADMGDVVRSRPKPKRRKGTLKQAVVRTADKWFAKFIVLRDRACIICGKTTDLQCSHLYRRTHYATRWDVRNAAALCKSCHFKHHKDSEKPFIQAMEKRLGGRDELDDLYVEAHTVAKFSADTIKGFGDSFRQWCKERE